MQLKDFLTCLMSGASFILSGYALWIAQFNRGRLKMTRPTLLCLKLELRDRIPKIFLRTLLFTTGTKGCVVESMFLKVYQGGKAHVGPAGIACNHWPIEAREAD